MYLLTVPRRSRRQDPARVRRRSREFACSEVLAGCAVAVDVTMDDLPTGERVGCAGEEGRARIAGFLRRLHHVDGTER